MKIMNLNYPQHIYPGTFDPFHKSHLNTWKEGSKKVGRELDILICINPLKQAGLLSPAKRKQDIVYTLAIDAIENGIYTRFDDAVKHYTQKIHIADNDETIKNYLQHAETITRGIRSKEDILYIERLLAYYHAPHLRDKANLVKVPEELNYLSSTKTKIALQLYLRDYAELPEQYKAFITIEDFLKLKSSNLVYNELQPGDEQKIKNNIHAYFQKIALYMSDYKKASS